MIQFTFTHIGGIPGSRSFPRREYNRIRKEALEAVGNYWHHHFRGLHFTREGGKKYGYTPRSGEQSGASGGKFWQRYAGRKQRIKGHQRPLVWSGKSEELSRRRDFKIKSTGSGATLRILIHAQALYFRNPFSDIDMVKEMTTVTEDELRILAGVYEETLVRLMVAYRDTVTVRYRGSGGGGSFGGAAAGSFAAEMAA